MSNHHKQFRATLDSKGNTNQSQYSADSQAAMNQGDQNTQEQFLNGLGAERGSLNINNKNYFVKFEHTNFSE